MSRPTATFTATTTSEASAVRRSLVRVLEAAGLGRTQTEDAAVMASELMTNALLHAGSVAHVQVVHEDDGIRVLVSDDDHDAPVVRPADPAVEGGNGLRIVDALSDEWGTVQHDGNGKDVWFRILVS